MHLASRFVINCLVNAREDNALAFFESIQTLDFFKNFQIKLSDLDSLLLTDPKAGVGGGGLLAADSSFREVKLRTTDHKRLLALVEAAVRLAALFHDLGHMPFSHDFEYALLDYIGKKKRANLLTLSGLTGLFPGQPHETVGHKLAQLRFPPVPWIWEACTDVNFVQCRAGNLSRMSQQLHRFINRLCISRRTIRDHP